MIIRWDFVSSISEKGGALKNHFYFIRIFLAFCPNVLGHIFWDTKHKWTRELG